MKKIYLFLFSMLFVSINSCKKDEPEINNNTNNAKIPSVETVNVSNIFITSATCEGNITDDGGALVLVRGVCYSTNPNPTTTDSKTDSGTGTGIFKGYLYDLTPNTTYYIRAYATNPKGTAYGDEIQFTTQEEAGIVTDIDGNTYSSIVVDKKVWMAEDLRVTHYPNGDAIPNVIENTDWSNLNMNNTDDAYCFYNNDSNTDYGALYTYAAAIGDNWQRDNTGIDEEGGQGVCPDGWHLPTDEEWVSLRYHIINNGNPGSAGGKMKEVGTLHWNSPNTGADNSTGFTALPGGYRRNNDGVFIGLGDLSIWWSATDSSTMSYYWSASYDKSYLKHQYYDKSNASSVRCVRD